MIKKKKKKKTHKGVVPYNHIFITLVLNVLVILQAVDRSCACRVTLHFVVK